MNGEILENALAEELYRLYVALRHGLFALAARNSLYAEQ